MLTLKTHDQLMLRVRLLADCDSRNLLLSIYLFHYFCFCMHGYWSTILVLLWWSGVHPDGWGLSGEEEDRQKAQERLLTPQSIRNEQRWDPAARWPCDDTEHPHLEKPAGFFLSWSAFVFLSFFRKCWFFHILCVENKQRKKKQTVVSLGLPPFLHLNQLPATWSWSNLIHLHRRLEVIVGL